MDRQKSFSAYWLLSVLSGFLLAGVAVVGVVTTVRGSNVFERDLGNGTLGQALMVPVLMCAALLAWSLLGERRRSVSRESHLAATNVELLRKEVFLEKQAITDALTGLYNRRYLYERLGSELRRAQRYNRPLSVILVDLDHFKGVNDEYGHQHGDVVLARFGRLLVESLREPDVPCRYGGEEFAVILPETGPEQAMAVAEKLRRRLKERDVVDDLGENVITISRHREEGGRRSLRGEERRTRPRGGSRGRAGRGARPHARPDGLALSQSCAHSSPRVGASARPAPKLPQSALGSRLAIVD
jgi:diguanylate cyclase (GGDEF)-like protein